MYAKWLCMGGGRSFATPIIGAGIPFVLTGARNAGNNPNVTPGAFQRDGKVIFGWVDSFGNVEAAERESGVTSAQQLIHAWEVDAHDSPALLRRLSDGRIIAVYTKHGSIIRKRLSTNPNSVVGWADTTDLDFYLGGSKYTNPQLHQLDAEANDPIVLIVRDEPVAGTDSRWVFSKSTDDGATWAAQTILYRVADARSYVKSHTNGTGRIDFIVTNGGTTVGALNGFTRLGHFYYEGGNWFKSDGTDIGDPPFTYDDVTEAYAGTLNVFASSIAIDASGYPVVGAQDTIAGALRYIYVRWNGSAWISKDVADCGTGYEYSGAGTGHTVYGSALDDGDPDDFFVIREVSGQPEVFRYRTADGGATFTPTQITTSSTELQTQLIAVQNPDSTMRVMWAVGTWTSYTNWNQRLWAVGS